MQNIEGAYYWNRRTSRLGVTFKYTQTVADLKRDKILEESVVGRHHNLFKKLPKGFFLQPFNANQDQTNVHVYRILDINKLRELAGPVA